MYSAYQAMSRRLIPFLALAFVVTLGVDSPLGASQPVGYRHDQADYVDRHAHHGRLADPHIEFSIEAKGPSGTPESWDDRDAAPSALAAQRDHQGHVRQSGWPDRERGGQYRKGWVAGCGWRKITFPAATPSSCGRRNSDCRREFRVTRRFQAAIAMAVAVLSTALLVSAESGFRPTFLQSDDPADTPEAKAALAKATVEVTARVLTVDHAQGKLLRTVGDRAVYNWPSFSPDRTKLAVSKRDEAMENTDIWILDLGTGTYNGGSHPIPRRIFRRCGRPTAARFRCLRRIPTILPGSIERLRTAVVRSELLYQIPGLPLYVSDWSSDGRFLSVNDPANLYLVPLAAAGPVGRRAADRSSVRAADAFRQISRLLAYVSNDSGSAEIRVRTVNSPALLHPLLPRCPTRSPMAEAWA